MKRMILIICLGGIVLGGLLGCIGFTPDWDPSWEKGWVHEKRHFAAFTFAHEDIGAGLPGLREFPQRDHVLAILRVRFRVLLI